MGELGNSLPPRVSVDQSFFLITFSKFTNRKYFLVKDLSGSEKLSGKYPISHDKISCSKSQKITPLMKKNLFLFDKKIPMPIGAANEKNWEFWPKKVFHSKKMNFSRVSGDWAKRHRCITLGSGVYHRGVYHRSSGKTSCVKNAIKKLA